MKSSFSKLFLFPLTALVLASLALAPLAEAARGGGGGGARAGGGGGMQAGGVGRQAVQPNNSRADVGTRDVRSTSVNNVNVNRNVNVDQNHRNWDHPVAAAVVVGAAIGATAAAVGSTVNILPVECVPVYYGGMDYQQCGSTWYQYQGGSTFVVVNPPY